MRVVGGGPYWRRGLHSTAVGIVVSITSLLLRAVAFLITLSCLVSTFEVARDTCALLFVGIFSFVLNTLSRSTASSNLKYPIQQNLLYSLDRFPHTHAKHQTHTHTHTTAIRQLARTIAARVTKKAVKLVVVASAAFVSHCQVVIAQGPSSQGPNFAGTAANGGGACVAWNNPASAEGNNLVDFAEATLADGGCSQTLLLTNFGFTIPTGSTITGIHARVYHGGAMITDLSVRLIVGGVIQGADRADPAQY
jgi:hypothetical protein